MPQDSVQQGIIRGALARFPQQPSTGDQPVTLSGIEIGVIRSVLTEFIRVPAEPSPGDPPRTMSAAVSRPAKKAAKKPAPKKKAAKSTKAKKLKKR